ncbi:MAG TPA: PH domain-containing protein [Rickettsia endosymbiont of Omalisus fontisbellaquei]|nr:PH domain-containing protein [Rickettsia endosymbiont of Omalisus fontisbellaquei]
MKIIKPTINIRYYSICSILVFILYSFVFITLGVSLIDVILLYFVIVIFSILGFKLFFHYIEFSFDDYKVSRTNSFISYERIDIRYEDIKEINLKRGLLERICNLGTISMLSNATAKKAGIKFFSIENPLEVYQELQSKIDQCKK